MKRTTCRQVSRLRPNRVVVRHCGEGQAVPRGRSFSICTQPSQALQTMHTEVSVKKQKPIPRLRSPVAVHYVRAALRLHVTSCSPFMFTSCQVDPARSGTRETSGRAGDEARSGGGADDRDMSQPNANAGSLDMGLFGFPG